jgi:hypothetical protein
MSSQCEKCNAPCWRHRGFFQLYTDYCKADELEVWDKSLLTIIKASPVTFKMGKQNIQFYSDGVRNYGLREDGTIIRIARINARNPDSEDINALREPPKEKAKLSSTKHMFRKKKKIICG